MEEPSVEPEENRDFEGSGYAGTEEELYRKAIGLLEKCRIEPRH